MPCDMISRQPGEERGKKSKKGAKREGEEEDGTDQEMAEVRRLPTVTRTAARCKCG
jgi:hypothetical protein